MSRASIRLLPDRRRLHLGDGPIDLIVEAFAPVPVVRVAYEAAADRFVTILDELCEELPLLRRPAGPGAAKPSSRIAERMWRAVLPFSARCFITPMAAVAGAVSDEMLRVMCCVGGTDLRRAYVNNGGDIALHLSPGESFEIGLVDRPDRPSLFGRARIGQGEGVGGLATSGWRGRSFSLGIADAVTVLAIDAASADAAATVIANAVDLPGHPAVMRRPARDRQPDSDLGDRPVTCAVGPLHPDEIARALASGSHEASRAVREGLIVGAALHLAGETVGVGPFDDTSDSPQTGRKRLVHA